MAEKVHGKTIRFVCRKCGHKQILFADSKKSSTNNGSNANIVSIVSDQKTRKRKRSLKALAASVSERETYSKDHPVPRNLQRMTSSRSARPVHYFLMKRKNAALAGDKEMAQLPKYVLDYLAAREIERMYDYQFRSFEAIQKGKHTVITAPTGFGKTEAFIFGVIGRITAARAATAATAATTDIADHPSSSGVQALLMYPTKALATDQVAKLRFACQLAGLRLGKLDGDSTREEREAVYDSPPDLLITNPDMVHVNLSRQERFRELLSGLKIVVMDEVHTFTGSFGTNVHFILKRLRRLYGHLQFVVASATISNAEEFAKTLLGITKLTHIDCGEARRGDLHFIMLLAIGGSLAYALAETTVGLVKGGKKVICFAQSHKLVERTHMILREQGIKSGVHRAGLSKAHRRDVESKFRSGELQAISCTSTMELGIDVGEVGAVVTSICPITNMLQRIGRAGRRGQDALGIMLLRNDDPISTYYLTHPASYFTDVRAGYIEPSNEIAARYQALSMLLDEPLSEKEIIELDVNMRDALGKLRDADAVGMYRERLRIRTDKSAIDELKEYSIRGIAANVKIVADKNRRKELGSRNLPMAYRELFPGATYLMGGEKYRVAEFVDSPADKIAVLRMLPRDHRLATRAMRTVYPSLVDIIETRQVLGGCIVYAKLTILEEVSGYSIYHELSGDQLDERRLDHPLRYEYETRGFLFGAPFPSKNAAEREDDPDFVAGSYHAVEHVLIETSDMLTGGASMEIGGVAMGDTGNIVVYDGVPGGSGASKLLYERFEIAVERASAVLMDCSCDSPSGCPRCTYSYRCGNNNEPLSKLGALESLLAMKDMKLRLVTELQGSKPLV